ncbi:MAG: hypothetical protein LBG06_08315 [Deltaproteobacteria bacterium]|jgi:hypothetical protein|nr:hypothetical protein [Deltaproteobacteria bacterium]
MPWLAEGYRGLAVMMRGHGEILGVLERRIRGGLRKSLLDILAIAFASVVTSAGAIALRKLIPGH